MKIEIELPEFLLTSLITYTERYGEAAQYTEDVKDWFQQITGKIEGYYELYTWGLLTEWGSSNMYCELTVMGKKIVEQLNKR